ncbi:MAG: Methanol dehydrogenase [cytochrome c] subunit 1 [Gammaproteobacteria bacterium]|nr:Methanol dehydrogenase [cytochrome c] subunit 1 [Gammaproteobacteria bacterium]
MRKLNKKWVFAALSLAVPSVVFANESVEKLMKNPNYWAFPGLNYWNWRYSSLDQINTSNVDKLQVAWTFSTGRLQGHEGGPLVLPAEATGRSNDTLYIHSAFPNDVFAIDLDTLEIVWEYDPIQEESVQGVLCCDNVNRGLGYGDGMIFLQQNDTTLVALKAGTGEKVWEIKNGDPKLGQTNTNAPHVMKDKVITGMSGAEFGVRCWLNAYNIKDGSLVWRAYSMGPDGDILMDPEKTTSMLKPVGKDSSLKTWKGDQWKIGGGSTWGWWPYDKEENLLYYGTGNPSTWNPTVRPGDNKWSMSIIARDVDTGMARWAYQMTPHDEWDYDGINEMILVDMKVKGKDRKVLVHFDRNGFGYTLDRVTGELLVAEKFDPAVNWATHVDMKTGRPLVVESKSTHSGGEDTVSKDICPAALGTKDQQPAAYSPLTGLFYVPTNHVCMTYEPVSSPLYEAGKPYVFANLTMFPAGKVSPGPEFGNSETNDNMGNFIAWDADAGKIVWSIPERWSVWSGVLTTAGGIAFYGTLEGWEKAVDQKSGKLLWKHKAPSGIIGNTHTWVHGGKQYIGVLSGIGGWAGAVVAFRKEQTAPDEWALGAAGGYRALKSVSKNGGVLMVYALP